MMNCTDKDCCYHGQPKASSCACMSAKHTPGEWRFTEGNQIRSEKDMIAKVWMMRDGEGKANARLIAAAPDLLEALQLAKLGIEVAAEKAQEYEDKTWIADVLALDKISAAIRKALGDES